jgi:hypothetical protein
MMAGVVGPLRSNNPCAMDNPYEPKTFYGQIDQSVISS